MNARRSPAGLVQALRRRSRVVAVLALVAMIAACVVSLLVPRTYSAEADVQLGWTSGSGGTAFIARVADVRERLQSHDTLAAVAKELDLGAKFAALPEAERSSRTEELLAALRENTTVSEGAPSPSSATITVTVRDSDKDTCAKVAAAIAGQAKGLHVDHGTNDKQQAADDLAKTVAEAQTAYDAAAAALDDFRETNQEFLGGAGAKLKATRDQKQQLRETTINGLEQQKKQLDELVAQEKQFETVSVRQADPVRLAGIDDRVADARERIRVLTVEDKKADTDSEVVAQRVRLNGLEEERKKLLADSPLAETRRANEQWVLLTKARADVQSQLDAAGRQLKLLVAAEKELLELARRTPEFEAKEKVLDTAETAAKQTLEEKSSALAAAESVLAAARERGSLTIAAAAPRGPGTPAGPGALMIALAGLAIGAIAGVTAAIVRDRMDHSFRDVDAVAGFLGVPTLGAVDVIETPSESAARRARARRSRASLASLGIAAALVLALAVFGSVQGVVDLVKSVAG